MLASRLCPICQKVPIHAGQEVCSGKCRAARGSDMIRKLANGKYRIYSRSKDARTGRRKNLGTFATRAAAERHERAIQYFKRH